MGQGAEADKEQQRCGGDPGRATQLWRCDLKKQKEKGFAAPLFQKVRADPKSQTIVEQQQQQRQEKEQLQQEQQQHLQQQHVQQQQ